MTFGKPTFFEQAARVLATFQQRYQPANTHDREMHEAPTVDGSTLAGLPFGHLPRNWLKGNRDVRRSARRDGPHIPPGEISFDRPSSALEPEHATAKVGRMRQAHCGGNQSHPSQTCST
jgi:hypothetical protein